MNKKEFFYSLNIFQIILWGYSTLQIVIIIILGFLPQAPTGGGDDPVAGIIAYAPMFLFIILLIARHKKYVWNVWKIVLTAYSVLFSLLLCATIILSAIIKPTVEGTSATVHSNVSFGLLFLIPIFILCVIFAQEILRQAR